jgi:AraC-like DNA-binding protein
MLYVVMFMCRLDLNKEIKYLSSSLRFFAEKEHHITRVCEADVLLLVYEGVLRFTEDGVPYEIYPGQYHIQKHNSYQTGELPSDGPKYLYVHFLGEWTEESGALAKNGMFDYDVLKADIEEMHQLSYCAAPYVVKAAKLYEILAKLYKSKNADTLASRMAAFLEKNHQNNVDLDMLCRRFSFSKNHIINIFKKEYGKTPIAYLADVRLNHAEQLLTATSVSIEQIAYDCGYRNYSHFYRQFLDKNRVSPEQFRQQRRLGK